jgi:hypothetical protein
MKAICAWCGKELGEREPIEDESLTHGMCEACLNTKFGFLVHLGGKEPVRFLTPRGSKELVRNRENEPFMRQNIE